MLRNPLWSTADHLSPARGLWVSPPDCLILLSIEKPTPKQKVTLHVPFLYFLSNLKLCDYTRSLFDETVLVAKLNNAALYFQVKLKGDIVGLLFFYLIGGNLKEQGKWHLTMGSCTPDSVSANGPGWAETEAGKEELWPVRQEPDLGLNLWTPFLISTMGSTG